ncbi:MAG TPA: UDP-N-acetylmuramate dehydrogenase [Acidimicrobiales bacterium]|nr:UDP-N-acetylmuramate dehydrogenase [Acidimicrobiales bacterium]
MRAGVEEAVEAAAALLGRRARRHEPLGALTTYRVGGPAALLVVVDDEGDLELVHRAVAETGVGVLVLGKGSNVLVADEGFPGLVVALGDAYSGLDTGGPTVRAGGGLGLPVLARRTAAAGLTGLEWAVGVPGSVGGGVRMNAGGHGSDMAACVVAAEVVDLATGASESWGPDRLAHGYRSSAVGARHLVIGAELRAEPGDREASERTIGEIVRWRRANQPGGQNAGSVFTNPPGDSAGRLVDAAGLKGHRLGGAQVSPKHANFIQAEPGAKAADVFRLIEFVADRVEAATGVRLRPEVRLVGFGDDRRGEED